MFLIHPRLFISYAREDIVFARSFNSALAQAGYKIFFDESSILVGDVFPEKIVDELKKCDGCIVFISNSSVNSEWCKLETYYAHFFRKLLIPIKLGNGDYDSESPLKSFQKNIQYVTVTDLSQVAATINLVKDKLAIVKKNVRKRLIKTLGMLCLLCLLIAFAFTFGIKRINKLAYNNEKSSLLASISKSSKIFNKQEIQLIEEKFKNDRGIIAQLHFQDVDPTLSEIARINSKIISSALLQSFSFSKRQYFKSIEWESSVFNNNAFNNTSFISGHISEVDFYNSKFNDVYFRGIDSEQSGIGLSGLTFSNCSFNSVSFDKSNAIDLNFKACSFNGSFLNTTNFGSVNFLSDSAENPAVITNGILASFQNCTFQNDSELEAKGTIVFGKEEEMQFVDVLFDGCRFVGLVRPEWFKKCTFLNCYFPSNELIAQLEGKNIMNNSKID